MSHSHFYNINGKKVRADQAVLSVQDLAFSRGYAAFESIRTYHGIPFRLDAHLKRLQITLKLLCLKLPVSVRVLSKWVYDTLQSNSFSESLIKIYVTGGISSTILPQASPNIVICVDEFHPFPPAQYQKGIKLFSTSLSRTLPAAKSTTYLAGVLSTIQARKRGFEESIFIDAKGMFLEGSTFNLMAIQGQNLITPRDHILMGITSLEVLKLASKHGLKLIRRSISKNDLKKCSELFITSSNREIIPVVQVDQIRIGNGKPGPIARALHEHYQQIALKACRNLANKKT